MITLKDKFKELCEKESSFDPDLHQTLYKYAKECKHITEVGMRWVETTFTFLMGKPKVLVSVDIDHPNIHSEFNGADNFELAKKLASEQGTDFKFIQANILNIELAPTDLLFIDTEHSYLQLKTELRIHSTKAQKYIILHDTVTHATIDSRSYGLQDTLKEIDPGDYNKRGLKLAITEFLSKTSDWKLLEEVKTGQGLTILKRTLK